MLKNDLWSLGLNRLCIKGHNEFWPNDYGWELMVYLVLLQVCYLSTERGILLHDLSLVHVLVTLLSAYVWSLRLEQTEVNDKKNW